MGRKDSALNRTDVKAFLGPGSKFEGKMVFTEIVRLDGTFLGEIESSDTLIVGQTGELFAEVKVGNLVISGRLKGNIKAKSKVELRSPAVIHGNIETPVLTIEEGVTVNGQILMTSEAAPEAKAFDEKNVKSMKSAKGAA